MFLTTKQQQELMEKAASLLTDEEKERSARLFDMTQGQSTFMGSAIEQMIRKQGGVKTREDLEALVISIERLIKKMKSDDAPVS